MQKKLGGIPTVTASVNFATEKATVTAPPSVQLHRLVQAVEQAAVVSNLRARGHRVAMAGDGIDDGPALVTADLGLARLAWETHRVIRRNLAWAFGYNAAAIPLAAAGLLNSLIAGAAMAVSSVFVVANSVRLTNSAKPRPMAAVPRSSQPTAATA